MALTDTAPETETPLPEAEEAPAERSGPSGLELVLGSGENTVIGRVFVFGALLMLALDLVAAGLIQLNVASSGSLNQTLVTRLQPNHLLGLTLCGIIPLFLGIAFVVVPRQVGSAAVAFPRAAAASAWTWLFSSVIFVVAVIGNGSYGGANREFSRMGNVATGAIMVSLILAAVCVASTVLTCRPMGMRLGDVPFFSFSMLVASVIWMLTLPAGVAHITLGHITHATPSTLLAKTYGEGLAWLFHQPALYALAIPVLGIALDAVIHLTGGTPRFRGVLFGFIGLFGLLSFGAWAQSAEAQATIVWVGFSMLIVLPVLVVFGSLGDTARTGRFTVASPLGFAVLSMFLLLVGTLIGVLQAVNTFGHGELANFDVPSLALGQFYIVAGAAVVAALGACFYWGSLLFGDKLPDAAGKGIVALAVLGVLLLGGSLVVVGLSTPDDSGFRTFAGIATAGAFVLAVATLAVLGAGLSTLMRSRRGDELLPDPWGGGGTLEWTVAGSVESVSGPYPLLEMKEVEA